MTHPSDFEAEARTLVSQLTLDEKASLCSGSSFWNTQPIERVGLPKVAVSDGPHGLRRQLDGQDHLGLGGAVPATCFPAGVNIASSWDVALCREMAEALAAECKLHGVSVVLGPAMNMKRNPLCGRSFEYYSEDPYLAGELAATFVQGVQSQGVGTSVKHFAANSQETSRMRVDTLVDERTLREIYLPAFERAVTIAQPWTVMSAYNRLNGTYCSEHPWLLGTVLRGDWGFRGLVVSDWGGTNDRVGGVKFGEDLEMPSSGGVNDRRVVAAVESGALDVRDLDRAVTRVVSLVLASHRTIAAHAATRAGGPEDGPALLKANHAFALRAATETFVLLKNDGAVLPFAVGATTKLAVVGSFAVTPRFQGAGSSRINAHQIDEPLAAIRAHVGGATEVVYAAGYDDVCTDDEAAVAEAVGVARSADAVVIFAGLPSAREAEGVDREHMRIPEQMNRLIAAVGGVNPRTAVVLMCGAPVELPTHPTVPAILYAGLGGQAVGGALAQVLFGGVSPSGKLAETWASRLEDIPSLSNFGKHPRQVVYREALNVGYRYFCAPDAPKVEFAFGHGLSYTRFGYTNLSLSSDRLDLTRRAAGHEPTLTATVDVTNLGAVGAAEVVQLYVRDVVSTVHRPDRELKGFAKIFLAPGQSETVSFTLGERAFAFYDTAAADWYAEPGAFELLVAASAEDIRLTATVDVINKDRGDAVGGSGVVPSSCRILDDERLARLGLTVPPPDELLPIDRNTTFD
jgi:beta-glucosidase